MNSLPHDVSKSPPGGHRLHELDVLRGVAAVAVLGCHYTSECLAVGRLGFDFPLGSYGPHLFFIISGFVILMSAQRSQRPGDFAFSRWARLYPVYWFAVIISTTIRLLAPFGMTAQPTTGQFLGNLTMLQTWLRIPDIEVAYWTLGVELKFYFLVLLLMSFRKLNRIEGFSFSWLMAVILYRCADAWVVLPHAFGTPLILDYAHLFVAGIMFHQIWRHGHSRLRHGVILMAVPMQLWAADLESAVMITGFLVVFYLFVFEKLRWLSTKPLCFLGKISYPLYLIHGGIGVALINGLADTNLHVGWLLVLPALVSLAGATLLTFYLERPQRWLRGWYEGKSMSSMQSGTLARI